MFCLGLIVNPIAGMGGRVGLKGTDGLAEKARQLGAIPMASIRAGRAVKGLSELRGDLLILSAPGEMGETVAKETGLSVKVLDMAPGDPTTAADTRRAAEMLKREGVDLILFAGGDGTARDICEAVGESVPAMGIPAGVKIHSPVFSRTPEAAGELILSIIRSRVEGKGPLFNLQEVLDIDEAAYREGYCNTALYGYLKVPAARQMQGRKAGSQISESGAQNQIALDFIDRMVENRYYFVGAGSTTRPIMENLNISHTLLGVDVILNRSLVKRDASEQEILQITQGMPYTIIITPIGGQGYLFGRGNQQISPELIQKAGKENIWIGATLQKIGTLKGEPFLVDTGDPETDRLMTGYVRVTINYHQEMIYPVA
ncbi:MAG: ATP-NAD kinase family protein [Desulfotignum sp.]|nr:ATP-NAD kinase family protein [Desulfotignum sp.]